MTIDCEDMKGLANNNKNELVYMQQKEHSHLHVPDGIKRNDAVL